MSEMLTECTPYYYLPLGVKTHNRLISCELSLVIRCITSPHPLSLARWVLFICLGMRKAVVILSLAVSVLSLASWAQARSGDDASHLAYQPTRMGLPLAVPTPPEAASAPSDSSFRIGPGDTLFVGAGEEHRFQEITEDLSLLVFFAPSESE